MSSSIRNTDVLILGAGAAGLFCALTAGRRGRKVAVLEHNDRVGEKIRISGGGRCNFTNLNVSSSNFLSQNRHFATSALSRYTERDFIRLVEDHGIRYHEKKDGQLFCDDGAGKIIDMLLRECRDAGVEIITGVNVKRVKRTELFEVDTEIRKGAEAGNMILYAGAALVVATGGMSIPKLGATGLGYEIARSFGIPIIEPRPGLVPLTITGTEGGQDWAALSGVSLRAKVTVSGISFLDDILLTHRGLSGPAILQASSYWEASKPISIDLLPDRSLKDILEGHTGRALHNAFEGIWPKRFASAWLPEGLAHRIVGTIGKTDLRDLEDRIHHWSVRPDGSEGFQKAEVTVGGIDTHTLSSKTMESRLVKGLFFIGEVVDVTGWLGGYNFQWAWSSGFAAGSAI